MKREKKQTQKYKKNGESLHKVCVLQSKIPLKTESIERNRGNENLIGMEGKMQNRKNGKKSNKKNMTYGKKREDVFIEDFFGDDDEGFDEDELPDDTYYEWEYGNHDP